MPSKIRDSSPERKRERREPSKTDRADRTERRERHRSHRKTSTKEKSSSHTSTSPADQKRRSSMTNTSDTEDGLVKTESRSSLPYPSFSKAHSKEAVGNASRPNLTIFTPPPTDLDAAKDNPPTARRISEVIEPPSPPLTDHNVTKSKLVGKTATVETIPEENKSGIAIQKIKTSKPHSLLSKPIERLRSSSDVGLNVSPVPQSTPRTSTPVKLTESQIKSPQRSVSQPTRTASPATNGSITEVGSALSSEATSIAPEQPSIQRPGSKVLPVTATFGPARYTSLEARQPIAQMATTPDIIIETEEEDEGRPTPSATPGLSDDIEALPPPPPPPMMVPISVPRVDYLLQNGGLVHPVTKTLLMAGKPMAVQMASPLQSPTVISGLFQPYNQLLDDFDKVISKNGSLAVATGYRSVARRLLDRLEAVFARDISSETCQCPMCERQYYGQDVRGVSWGEILELVSGRQDLPEWPPFSFVASTASPNAPLELHTPMTKLDIDVPEEYREHYIRQSRKTKLNVDKWLNRYSDTPTSPPEEVDDETLSFAIMTHLEPEQRQTYKDILCIVDRPLEPRKQDIGVDGNPVPSRCNSVAPRVRPDYVAIAATAIQRLYRLGSIPRDPETASFLVNNPTLHNSLATLAAVSDDEWEILTSGRFDGFLRSGADDVPDPHPKSLPHRTGSRGPIAANGHFHARRSSQSRTNTGTPAHYGAPIAYDEEVEIATLAEIERDIYTSMEQLEDAFETLHLKAEGVRRILRERSAGLAAAAQRRRGSSAVPGTPGGPDDFRLSTPASGIVQGGGMGQYGLGNGFGNWDNETDDGLGDWDGVSEIAPDDSASNISSSRRRKHKRRKERSTPAPIDEDDEEDEGGYGESRDPSPRKR